MLIFASDLHLTDSARRSSFSAAAFARSLEDVLRGAMDDRVAEVQLVLLGDVLEILKSTRWEIENTRPWEPCTPAHVNTVTEIVNAIFDQNADFFAALDRLRGHYPLTVSYIPGNHDAALNTEMGDSVRARFRTLLGQKPERRRFDEFLKDSRHRVLARHGHHWDPDNRYPTRNAIGDFIVIEVLTRLPLALATHLGIDVNDPRLTFAHQLDDVVPQTTYARAKWLAEGVEKLTSLRGRKAMRNALGQVAEELEARTRGRRFDSTLGAWWVKLLKRLVPRVAGTFDLLSFAEHFARSAPPPPPQLSEQAKGDLRGMKKTTDYVVYGHTHVPEYRTINAFRTHHYLNCGAWRRIHRRADSAMPGTSGFVTTNFGALAVIRAIEERLTDRPRHELRYLYYA